jgi:hypothetical protein
MSEYAPRGASCEMSRHDLGGYDGLSDRGRGHQARDAEMRPRRSDVVGITAL